MKKLPPKTIGLGGSASGWRDLNFRVAGFFRLLGYLSGHRSAEEGQYSLAYESGHSAFVSDNRLDHLVEGLIHDLGPLFVVKLFGEGG
jgi:hypothetical protein